MEQKPESNETPKPKRKRFLWLGILGVVVLLAAIGGVEAYRILYQPQNLFQQSTMDPALLATPTATPEPTPEITAKPGTPDATGTPEPTPTPTIEPTPSPTPGITETKDIVNILLIGIDRRQGVDGNNKGTPDSEGTDPHADVQMIVAINFKTKKVDLISLPRDTFIHNPELMDGVYKINATFNVGGGFEAKDNAGFMNVCKGAEYMLGGIPVDYYYAVDFNALVKLVDAIGGVDYEVEDRAYSRTKKKGKQHMTGADVLFYVRVRKAGPQQGDLSRINRQKDMMIAIFKQLKEKGKLSMVPDLINTAKSQVYTNTNLEQTIALANFAQSIDPAKIGMHSMAGPSADAARWRWCFTDQKKRLKLIKDVYGIDVKEQVRYSEDYAHWLMSYGFDGMVHLSTAKKLIDTYDTRQTGFNEEQKKAYDAMKAAHTKAQAAWNAASLSMKSTQNRAMTTTKKDLKAKATAFAKLVGHKEKIDWTYSHNYWWQEPRINKVQVNFN